MQGVILDDKNIISRFDPTYADSIFIKSLKTLKNGEFSSYSKVKSSDKFKEYIDIALEKVKEIDASIRNNNFNIDPKILNGKNISCAYCPFKDICCHTLKDEVELKVKEGEDDGE